MAEATKRTYHKLKTLTVFSVIASLLISFVAIFMIGMTFDGPSPNILVRTYVQFVILSIPVSCWGGIYYSCKFKEIKNSIWALSFPAYYFLVYYVLQLAMQLVYNFNHA